MSYAHSLTIMLSFLFPFYCSFFKSILDLQCCVVNLQWCVAKYFSVCVYIYIYIYIVFPILYPCKLLNIEFSFLFYTVGPKNRVPISSVQSLSYI